LPAPPPLPPISVGSRYLFLFGKEGRAPRSQLSDPTGCLSGLCFVCGPQMFKDESSPVKIFHLLIRRRSFTDARTENTASQPRPPSPPGRFPFFFQTSSIVRHPALEQQCSHWLLLFPLRWSSLLSGPIVKIHLLLSCGVPISSCDRTESSVADLVAFHVCTAPLFFLALPLLVRIRIFFTVAGSNSMRCRFSFPSSAFLSLFTSPSAESDCLLPNFKLSRRRLRSSLLVNPQVPPLGRAASNLPCGLTQRDGEERIISLYGWKFQLPRPRLICNKSALCGTQILQFLTSSKPLQSPLPRSPLLSWSLFLFKADFVVGALSTPKTPSFIALRSSCSQIKRTSFSRPNVRRCFPNDPHSLPLAADIKFWDDVFLVLAGFRRMEK